MGKIVKCPKCLHEFKEPIFGEKRSGFGITFAAIGDLTCSNCGYKGHTSEFVAAEKEGSGPE